MKLCIITEGGVEKGFGHIKRMLYLANILRNRGHEVNFLIESNEIIRAKILEENFSVTVERCIQELKKFDQVNAFIIDKRDVETELISFIRNDTNARVIIFGNVSDANKYAHLVINSVIGSSAQNCIKKNEKTSTVFLQGPKYALLGEDFLSRRDSHIRRSDLKKILLLFGGSDPSNLTYTVCKQLQHENDWQITVCIGPLFSHIESLNEICENHPEDKFHIVRESTKVYDLMLDNDILITSPGNTLLEAFCIGIPVIAFYQNTFQKDAFEKFPAVHNNEEIRNLNELINKTYKHFGVQRRISEKLEVGKGIVEIINHIEE